MFSNNPVASTWGNPQQNPQQQQQPSAFGQQPTGFGNSAFGSTGGFGQPQQQQPQANPMFGNLGGTPSTNQGTTGFGAFGSAANTSQSGATSSIFGAPKPTGFGAFGGTTTGAFGGGGAFGQPNTAAGGSGTTGLFGQPAATTGGAFGGGSSAFGTKPATAFGSTTTTSTAGNQIPPPVTTGSSNPPYSAFSEKDTGSNNNVMLHYQAISCMPAYLGTSFEELRLQDYQQGRKTSTNSFGQSAAFGTTPQPSTGIFGAQPAQQSSQSAFGAPGANTGFGAFSTPNANQGATAPTTSLFGGGGFGQPQQQPQTQTFGAFGAPTQQQQQQSQPPQQTGGLFGGGFGNAAKPPTTFGAFGNTASSGGFGGGFGQQSQPQQPPQQQQTGGLFGNTQQPATTGFGGFGNTAAKPSIFGSTTTAAQPAQTGFGAFGNTQQQTTQQPQTQPNSLFGNTASGGLFGNTTQQQSQQPNQPAANPLFGGANAQTGGTGLFGGGSLFNNPQQQQQQQQQQPQQQSAQTGGFGLFNKPPAPAGQSLFSGGFNQQPATNAPQQSLFGGTLGQSTAQQSTLNAGGLFGTKPTAPPLGSTSSTGQPGLFGSTNTGLFNSAANPPQGTLTASISQPVGSLFDMLPGPRLINLESSQPKKKSSFFVDIPTRSPVPRVQLGYTPANSKLRGFGASTSTSAGPGNPFASVSFTSGKPNALSLSRVGDNQPAIGADAFLGRSASPSLGSGPRQSVKKVILDKKVDPSELFIKSGGSPGLRGTKYTFSPGLSSAIREKDVLAITSSVSGAAESPTPAPRPLRAANRFTAQSTQNVLQSEDAEKQPGSGTLEEGDYWVKPDLATLKQTGYDELSSFKGLVVGRVGYGEIRFLEPVDLTGLPKLGALLGEVVRFDEKECSVYPDSEEVDKPPPGSGLNVRAKLALLHCWAVDKATREPIKDASHAVSIKHLKRLKNMKDTHFESFDIADGKWTFTVDHF